MTTTQVVTPRDLLAYFGGELGIVEKAPLIIPTVHESPGKYGSCVLYLKAPGVITLAWTDTLPVEVMKPFLAGFDKEYGFLDYVLDPNWLNPTEAVLKLAGQICYASFGPKGRTRNTAEGCEKYLTGIKSQKHGSVLEHANITFLIYGVSRSLTHELVRHRAGCAFSQLSQRYVDDRVVRFVMRPEYQGSAEEEEEFFRNAEQAAAAYKRRRELRLKTKEADPDFQALPPTDRRKAVNQSARACLPNETETSLVMTANIRAWRHILEMRGSEHAEPEIRILANRLLACLTVVAPVSFSDFECRLLPDGTFHLNTPYSKV